MKQSQVDYINFRYLLKGNYRKGVHALRSILADGGQAKAFAENPAAVAVVLSYDKENPDKNAEELYELLINSSVADIASATYVCSTYNVSSFDELAADPEIMAEVVLDASTMNGIAASETAMAAMVDSEIAMTAIAGSEIAMTAVTSTDVAVAAIAGSEIALVAIAASAVAMTAVADNAAIMEGIAGNNAAMATATANSEIMEIVAASETAMTTIAASSTAMSAVIASSTAIDAVVASDAAVAAIVGNEDAIAMSAGSAPLCVAIINGGGGTKLLASETAITTCSNSAECLAAVSSDSASLDLWWNSDNFWTNIVAASPYVAASASSCSGFIGKQKSFAVGSYGTFAFTVVAVGYNTLSAGGTAGFTFQSEDIIALYNMNSSSTTAGGWASCAMRTFLSNTILAGFPSNVKAAIAPAKINYHAQKGEAVSTCTDSLWLPSYMEAYGGTSCDTTGTKFPLYTSNSVRVKNYNGTAKAWWTRSVYDTLCFVHIASQGQGGWGDNATYQYGVAPCFCI